MSYCEICGGIATRRVSEGQCEVPRSRVGLINQQPVVRRFAMLSAAFWIGGQVA